MAGEKLLQAFNKLNEVHEFKVGDLVQWKPGMSHKRLPLVGSPAVVVSLHPGRVDRAEETGTQFFEEPLDLTLGVLARGEEFICFAHDSRRFEPYTGE